jgi:hypothetical protein
VSARRSLRPTLFVRARTTRDLRTLTGQRLVATPRHAYDDRVGVVPCADTAPPPGLVGVHVRGTRTVFSDWSSMGDRLYVELERGKIVAEDVHGLAFVF